MRGLGLMLGVTAAVAAAPAVAAPGLRVWTGQGEVVRGGKKLADVPSVSLLELPNGRFALMTMTKPVVYAFSGYGTADGRGQEHDLHVDTFAAQATPDSPGQKADDHCTLVWKPNSHAVQRIDCGAGSTWFNFHGDDRGPQLNRRFSAAEVASYRAHPHVDSRDGPGK